MKEPTVLSYFRAPWGGWVRYGSLLVTGLLVFLAVTGWSNYGAGTLWMRVLLLGLLLGAALFTVRGYAVTANAILVRRLLWSTPINLSGLKAVRLEPGAMRWALRTFGNGGFFSITGWFYSTRLGGFRAFVTDTQRTVVLEFKSRKVVISPDDPERFIQEVSPSIDVSESSAPSN